ncbi:MAG: response regulator [Chloroflexota bacterium]|nr:response regulator [Chloroflexota bacterium]
MPNLTPSPGVSNALIIEDDAHSLFAIALILRDLEVQFKRNTTGAKSTQQAAAMTPAPDFILLDLDLPSADALAVLRKLTADPRTRTIPVIAMTDRSCSDRGALALVGGALAVLAKPFSRRQLADLIASFPVRSDAAPSTPQTHDV